MNSRLPYRLAAALAFASCFASASGAVAQTPCAAGTADHARCTLSIREPGLDTLMTGSCCVDSAAGECGQVELAAAEELMAAQLHSTAGALRRAGNAEGALAALYTAQTAWEQYRDARCAMPEASDADGGRQTALGERCRFEFTVERILDLAQLHEDIQATVRRAARLD